MPLKAIESGSATKSVSVNIPNSSTGAPLTRRIPSRHADKMVMSDEEPVGQQMVLQPHQPRQRPSPCRRLRFRRERARVVGVVDVEEQCSLGIDLCADGAYRSIDLKQLPRVAAVPVPANVLVVFKNDAHVQREDAVAKA